MSNKQNSKTGKTKANAVAIRKTSGMKLDMVTLISLIFMAVTVVGILCLGTNLINVGTNALMENYDTAYASEREATYKAFYEKYFNKAEKEYHVANKVSISIEDMREIAKLEVLSVSDVEYIIENENNNSKGINTWLEVPGQGMYVVDLQAAEFVVDDSRAYVLVRVPNPELSNISIDYANVEKLFFKNDMFNDSYKVGEDLARQMLGTADLLIKKEFSSNQHFYKAAQEAAVSTIECMIKQFNPNYPDLTVEVEFY